MSIVSGFFNQTIDIYSVSIDAYNNVTETSAYSNVPCRFVETTTRVIDVTAATKTYRAECWIDSGYTIKMDYIVKHDGEKYRVAAVEKRVNLFGENDHIKLLLE